MNTTCLRIVLLFIITTAIYAFSPKQDYEEYKLKKTELIKSGYQQLAKNKSNNTRECNESWIADGYCDDTNNTEECGWDGGDCCGSTCISNDYDCGADSSWAACYAECLDPNPSANDDCCIDNTCPFHCGGNGLVECWDGSCAEEISDCPTQTCMDTDCSFYIDVYTCPEIENNYGYDCDLCEEEGLCLLSCEDEGYITCPNGDCANSDSECNTCDNPEIVYEGINTSSGHDEYFLTTVSESGFLTVSTAGAGVDTKFFIYSACENVDIDNFPYGEYIGYNDDWGSSEFGECPDCTYWAESYIYVSVPPGDYLIVSSDQYNQSNTPFEWLLSFDVGVEGCTNPFADNYNPEANIDDGSCVYADGTYFVTCDGGSWQSEITWDLISTQDGGVVLNGGAPYDTVITLDPGEYSLNAFDSFGDGWNGNIWSISDSNGVEILSYTLEDGSEGYSRAFNIVDTTCLLGDLNGDSIINISDVLILINAIIDNITEEYINCGDMDDDNVINVSDIILLVDIILRD